jgi:type III secretion system YscJ/HrcJ family lipoprotein
VRRALLACLLGFAACGVELEHGLDERQANQVAALLESAGVAATKERDPAGGFKIVVPRGELGRSFALLEANDLPRRGPKGLADTFAGSSLLPSALEEQARYASALGAELERTIERIPGVSAARVHLALPSDDALLAATANRPAPSASVLIKVKAAVIAEAEVARMVASGVPGLEPARVAVVMTHVDAQPAPPAVEPFGPLFVARGSRPLLATLAASGLALILVLATSLVVLGLRLTRLRRRVDEQA